MRSSVDVGPNRRESSGFSIDSFLMAYDDTIVLEPLAGHMTLVQHTITSKSSGGHTTIRYDPRKTDDHIFMASHITTI